jgi:hypothetical protein
MMAGFVAPIIQGLTTLRQFQDRQKAEAAESEAQAQQEQNLQEILVNMFMEQEMR